MKLISAAIDPQSGVLHVQTDVGDYTLAVEDVEGALVLNGQLCEYCLGEGEVSADGTDTEGNIERGVDTRKCICRVD